MAIAGRSEFSVEPLLKNAVVDPQLMIETLLAMEKTLVDLASKSHMPVALTKRLLQDARVEMMTHLEQALVKTADKNFGARDQRVAIGLYPNGHFEYIRLIGETEAQVIADALPTIQNLRPDKIIVSEYYGMMEDGEHGQILDIWSEFDRGCEYDVGYNEGPDEDEEQIPPPICGQQEVQVSKDDFYSEHEYEKVTVNDIYNHIHGDSSDPV